MKAKPQPRDLKRKVLIVDDHPLLREGLARVINQQADMVVCGQAADRSGGLAAVTKCRPDAAIVDIALGRDSGLELIKDIHALTPKLPILALSMHQEDLHAERVLRAGAQGYVMKGESVDIVIGGLRKVLSGHVAVSESILHRLIDACARGVPANSPSPSDLLSDRELEVFQCFGHGFGTRQIADKLNLAMSTVESYRASIKQKLGLASGTELIACAARFIASQTAG